MKRSAHQIMALVVAELVKGPATIGALCLTIGVPPTRSDRLHTYLKPLRDAGAVRICGWVTRQTPIMGLQSAPHALPDEPLPPMWTRTRKTARRWSDEDRAKLVAAWQRRREVLPLGPNSVFALGSP